MQSTETALCFSYKQNSDLMMIHSLEHREYLIEFRWETNFITSIYLYNKTGHQVCCVFKLTDYEMTEVQSKLKGTS